MQTLFVLWNTDTRAAQHKETQRLENFFSSYTKWAIFIQETGHSQQDQHPVVSNTCMVNT